MAQPVVVIVGATGTQGGSVISTFLADGAYHVRGLTRKVDGEKAQALRARGVEVAYADLNDQASLIQAFHGATAIYAVTDFFEPFMTRGPDAAVKIETAQGINLASAAAATPTLQHYIWSTLAPARRISGGKYIIPHFEAKNRIDEWIIQNPVLHPKTTFLMNSYYATNLLYPLFTPNFLKSSGKYVWLQPIPPTTTIVSVGDQRANIGPFALAIVKQSNLTLPGKYVLAATESLTAGDLLNTWAEVTGKKAEYVEISLEDFDRLWPMWGREMGVMLKFWEEAGENSWSVEGEKLITKEDLGIEGTKLVGIKEAFARIDWTGI